GGRAGRDVRLISGAAGRCRRAVTGGSAACAENDRPYQGAPARHARLLGACLHMDGTLPNRLAAPMPINGGVDPAARAEPPQRSPAASLTLRPFPCITCPRTFVLAPQRRSRPTRRARDTECRVVD